MPGVTEYALGIIEQRIASADLSAVQVNDMNLRDGEDG